MEAALPVCDRIMSLAFVSMIGPVCIETASCHMDLLGGTLPEMVGPPRTLHEGPRPDLGHAACILFSLVLNFSAMVVCAGKKERKELTPTPPTEPPPIMAQVPKAKSASKAASSASAESPFEPLGVFASPPANQSVTSGEIPVNQMSVGDPVSRLKDAMEGLSEILERYNPLKWIVMEKPLILPPEKPLPALSFLTTPPPHADQPMGPSLVYQVMQAPPPLPPRAMVTAH